MGHKPRPAEVPTETAASIATMDMAAVTLGIEFVAQALTELLSEHPGEALSANEISLKQQLEHGRELLLARKRALMSGQCMDQFPASAGLSSSTGGNASRKTSGRHGAMSDGK